MRCLSFLTGCFFFSIGFDLTSRTNLSESLWLIFFGGDFFRSEVWGFGPKEMTKKESPSSLTVIADSTQGLSHAIPPGEQGNLTMHHTDDGRNPANQLVW